MKNLILLLLISLQLINCKNEATPVVAEKSIPQKEETTIVIKENTDTFSRAPILERLNAKIKDKKPLVVHVYIPLCDNVNQGIVPTTESLGNGMSIKTNLYWATSSAMKKFFQKHPGWKQIYSKEKINDDVLERIAFERDYEGIKVYLVADAYRGDRMGATLNDYLAALSSNKKETLLIGDSLEIEIAEAADLLIFNGHNGLMDNPEMKNWVNKGDKYTDAVLNACVTYEYFEKELIKAKAYPLVRTKSLLHPGAYVLTEIIDDWVHQVPANQIAANAGKAYCKVHDCGTGKNIYKSGWFVEE